jgi:hypothetical protein
MFIEHAITALPKEEESSIASSIEDQALEKIMGKNYSRDLLEEQESLHDPIKDPEHEEAYPSFFAHEDKVLLSFPQISKPIRLLKILRKTYIQIYLHLNLMKIKATKKVF